ncbi:MAG: hydroxysqualene dehydroxylase HpnE [Thiohalomonadales bacterium]
MSKKQPVIIVGGGWAGLTTAVELTRNKIPVLLLESAKQLGGRARRVPFKDDIAPTEKNRNEPTALQSSVDNGQHILLGAYETTLDLLKTVGVKEKEAFRRSILVFNMKSKKYKNVKLRVGRLPAPFHFVKGLLTAKGLSAKEKISALRFNYQMTEQEFELKSDISCLQLLQNHKQSERIIKFVWQPLCVATLNTPIEEASAQIFLTTLRETFAHARRDSHFLFPRRDLSALFPDPAMEYIERHHGQIRLATKVTNIILENDNIVGVTAQDQVYESKYVVLATPFHITKRYLDAYTNLSKVSEQLSTLESRPICTVYLHYAKRVSMGQEMVGFTDCTSQWAINRSTVGQKGLISVIISGRGHHMSLDNAALANLVAEEIAGFFPRWPRPKHCMVIREKQATLSCGVDVSKGRPDNRTPVNGLWLAGDYVNTGLPATIESAVRSGTRCARDIINRILS